MADELERDRKDWIVFLRLSRIQNAGGELSQPAVAELERIRHDHPEWNPGKDDRDDFPVWTESWTGDRGDLAKLSDVPTPELLGRMRSLIEADRMNNDGLWRRFVSSEPERSLEVLINAAEAGDWPSGEWSELFNYLINSDDRPLQLATFEFLENQDIAALGDSVSTLVQWMRHSQRRLVEYLQGPDRLLALWDKLGAAVADEPLTLDVDEDPVFAALNEPIGMLSLMLIDELARREGDAGNDLPADLSGRFEMLLSLDGAAALLAQVPMMRSLPFLEFRASKWVMERLVPLLAPDQDHSGTRWVARFSGGQVGSAALFNSASEGFWWSFRLRSEALPREAQVVHLLQAALRRIKGQGYKVSPQEAKAALMAAGDRALQHCANHLIVDGDTPQQKTTNWREISKPLFEFVWPGDDAARSNEVTQRLVRLALSADAEFPDAVKTIRPFLTPAWENDWGFDFAFDSDLGKELLRRFPRAGLELLDSLIPVDRGPRVLNELIDIIGAAEPQVAKDFRFQRLRALGRRLAA